MLVTAAAVIWVAGTVVGTGLVGDGVSQQANGLFSDHATLIAPHGPAFSIWSVVYLGLAGYVIWQWVPAAATSSWARVTRIPAAAAIALNGLWLFVVQAGLVWLSVLVMAGIVASLGILLRRAAVLPREGATATILVPATFGLYLGWICVATCANVASFLVGLGVPVATPASTAITVLVLAVVVGIAAYLMPRIGRPVAAGALAAAIVWGVSWVAVGRFTGTLRSDVVAWSAIVTAALVAAVWLLRGRASRVA